MESNSLQSIKTRHHVDTIASVLVPICLNRFAIISETWYYVLIALSLIISIVLLVLYSKKIVKDYRPSLMAFAVAAATSLCLIVSANIQKRDALKSYTYSVNTTFRDKYEKAADNGDIESLINLGAYYTFLSNRLLIQAPKRDIRDDDIVDPRNFKKANRYLEIAAYQYNSAAAYSLLGEMKFQGLGCLPSREHALDLFRKAYQIDPSERLLGNALKLHEITEEELSEKKD